MGRGPQPLHLLEVGIRWPPETFVTWKLEGLAARGMRVTVASSNVFEPEARLDGVELLTIPDQPSSTARALASALWRGLPVLLRSPRRLVRLVRNVVRRERAQGDRPLRSSLEVLARWLPLAGQRPDVVHFEWHSAAVHHLPLYDVWDCPVTTSCRGSDIAVYPHIPGSERYAGRLPAVFERVNAVHAVCEALVRDAWEFGLDPARARVARPGVDPSLFRPRERDDGEMAGGRGAGLSVLMVGWLRWEKGYEYALAAVRRLLDEGVQLSLEIVGRVPPERVGAGDERARILHTIADLGLESAVRLIGAAPSEEVSRKLRECDVFLHPSLTEGIPAAVIEAMACEVPVLVTDCGGITEAVSDGVEGLVVPPRDPESLASALGRLAADGAMRRRMGEAGRARVLAEFTLRDEHAVFLDMYRDAVAEGPRAGSTP